MGNAGKFSWDREKPSAHAPSWLVLPSPLACVPECWQRQRRAPSPSGSGPTNPSSPPPLSRLSTVDPLLSSTSHPHPPHPLHPSPLLPLLALPHPPIVLPFLLCYPTPCPPSCHPLVARLIPSTAPTNIAFPRDPTYTLLAFTILLEYCTDHYKTSPIIDLPVFQTHFFHLNFPHVF